MVGTRDPFPDCESQHTKSPDGWKLNLECGLSTDVVIVHVAVNTVESLLLVF